jgi:type I restriction enzyme S subunit
VIADLKPYLGYKDSGVGWLGYVPDDWNVAPARSLFDEVIDRNHPDEEMLSVTIEAGVIRQTDFLKDSQSKDGSNLDRSNYKLVLPGDIAYNKMRAWQGAVGRSSVKGIVSPAYIVMRSREDVEPGFVHRLLRIPAFAKEAERWSYGITSDQWSLRAKDFKQIYFPVPSAATQAAITRFLDHVDSRIQGFVVAKKRLIELLEEEKQTIIHRAVTRGLDPDASLKPSGIDWLGEVPEHWQVGSLRRFCSVVDCKHLTVPAVETGIPVASVREVQSFDLDLSSARSVSDASYRLLLEGGRRPAHGDLVYCRNVGVGACAYVATDANFALGQDVCLIRPRRENGRFVNYVMHSSGMHWQLAERLIGATFHRVNISEIKSFVLPIPPRREQDEIAVHLDAQLKSFDQLRDAASRHITLLRELRTRLISDVVTGKLDVREAVERFPRDPGAADTALDERLEEVIA